MFFQQSQHSDELTCSPVAPLFFEAIAQQGKRFRQRPVVQGFGVIECARLAFEQFEVVDGLEGNVLLFPDAIMFGNHAIITKDTHELRVPFDHHRMMGEACVFQ